MTLLCSFQQIPSVFSLALFLIGDPVGTVEGELVCESMNLGWIAETSAAPLGPCVLLGHMLMCR